MYIYVYIYIHITEDIIKNSKIMMKKMVLNHT